jgi:hypothetical protein
MPAGLLFFFFGIAGFLAVSGALINHETQDPLLSSNMSAAQSLQLMKSL